MKKQWVLIVIVCLTLLTVFHNMTSAGKQLPKQGYKAPSFSLPGLDGQIYSLDSLQGKPVMINFWASWCEPCRAEAPDLAAIYERYQGRIEILAVNVTTKDRVEDVQSFVQQYRIPFPVLLDEQAKVTEAYNIAPIPTTYFVNKNGIVVERVIGTTAPQLLEQKFLELLQ
jgi:cytochrome c biogenesis protein CcmG/thiol:disulfide interchange protein DsbE